MLQLFVEWRVALSCWHRAKLSLVIRPAFKNFCQNACNTSVCIHGPSKIKMSPIILVALTAHNTPSLTSCNGTLQMDKGTSTDQYPFHWELTYPPRWNTSVESNPAAHTLWRYHSTKLIYYINCIKHMYCTETYNPAIGHLCWLTMHKGPEKLSP
jgi:hypothetical protein